MFLDFRIDWGYQYLYSRRHYHPVYIWDGELECTNGTIETIRKLDYPVIWYGPGHCAKETLLEGNHWESRTKRGLAGIRVEAQAEPDTVFFLHTASADFTFTAGELLEKGRLVLDVGPKYLGCHVIVTITDHLWFRQPLRPGETAFEPEGLGLPVHHWARMKLAWVEPGASAEFDWEVPETGADCTQTLLHLVAMAAPAYSEERETQVRDVYPMTILCDGAVVCSFKRYLRMHDTYMQLLEDDWQRLEIPAGVHHFALRNDHPEHCLAVSRIVMKACTRMHGQVSVPDWALKNETVTGKVYAARAEELEVCVGERRIRLSCSEGWNEFPICIAEPGLIPVTAGDNTASIEIFDVEEEAVPVKVGYDMTVVPHDDNGFMDWLLDYTQRTRLGNYILFRTFTGQVAPELWSRWGEFCRTHGIYAASCIQYLEGSLIRAAGEMFHDCGLHEYPGLVYARDPMQPHCSRDMKEASEKYTAYLKLEIDKAHQVFPVTAFGDASGGIRYSYLAGADFVRAETMVGHTMTLLSQARPAAQALGDGRWGVHIAIQHAYQPYQENHLGQYFLSLMQPWAMGAETIYEEDCLFTMFKEERIAWDDLLTRGKRDMTRAFFKFVKTHPRRGVNTRRIAFLEGRYAAPFNGFICDVEQDPHYSVWGAFGNTDPTWGHGQPEKCRALLDVLMPGANTHPLRQRFDRRRHFFSGTPYGDFDCVPAEAEGAYLDGYRLLLNLGWNTAIAEDQEKLLAYVAGGGVLLTGIPQFSTHVERGFLADMEDLALLNGGDLRSLCGIVVNGPGETYCGQWNCADRTEMSEPALSAMPSDDPAEDGAARLADVTLCGAQVVAWDSFTGKPMLVRHAVGSGFVYTFTLWAYPGHEAFQKFAAAWVARLAEDARGDVYVEDPTGEVFWTVWEDGEQTHVMLLNTDWTKKHNEKTVTLYAGGRPCRITVRERSLAVASVGSGCMGVEQYTLE